MGGRWANVKGDIPSILVSYNFHMFIYMDGLLLIDLYDAKGIGQNLLISLL